MCGLLSCLSKDLARKVLQTFLFFSFVSFVFLFPSPSTVCYIPRLPNPLPLIELFLMY